MKCLICKTANAEIWIHNIKTKYPCFCPKCYWDSEYKYEDLQEILENHLNGGTQMEYLKFPDANDYPEGYNWFAYDKDGNGYFYRHSPCPSVKGTYWYSAFGYLYSYEFTVNFQIEKWDDTLREKPCCSQGIKYDDSKTNYLQVFNKDFIPTIEECSLILEQGSIKYSQDNWKSLDPERLKKALLRHLVAYLSDEIEDKESGQKHLSHVITNCLFLNWFEDKKG